MDSRVRHWLFCAFLDCVPQALVGLPEPMIENPRSSLFSERIGRSETPSCLIILQTPDVDLDQARRIMEIAHQTSPYSKALYCEASVTLIVD